MIDCTDMTVHRERFLAFTRQFGDVIGHAPLKLKVGHSFRVFRHVCRIMDGLDTSPEMMGEYAGDAFARRAAVLAALYHDCGRFIQFREYRTFSDDASADHALLGFRAVRSRAFMREESTEVRRLALCAILLHNRYSLPAHLDLRTRFVVNAVRDADKLDIMRIMVHHLESAVPKKDISFFHVKNEPNAWSPEIVRDVLEGRAARYADVRYVNDFHLLLGTWMREFCFPLTRIALARSGLMECILAPLDGLKGLAPALHLLHKQLDLCKKGEKVFI